MLKHIKWLCLITGIIGLFYLSLLYFNTQKKNPTNIDKSETFNIYNTTWYNTKVENYEDNMLIATTTLTEYLYIIFQKDYIEYIFPEKTNKYKYTYKDEILTITGPTDFLLEGSYKVSLENDLLKLSIDDNNKTKVYYFIGAEG